MVISCGAETTAPLLHKSRCCFCPLWSTLYTDACKYKPFAVICISQLFLKIWYPLNLFSRRKRAGEGHFHSYQLRQLLLMLMHHYQRQLCSHRSRLSHFASFASNRNCNSHEPHNHQHLQTQKFAHERLRSSFGGSCLAQVFQGRENAL